MIHQGTKLIPADFIAFAKRSIQEFDEDLELKECLDKHHKIFLSNFFAQTEALMQGKDARKVLKDFQDENAKRREKGQSELTDKEIARLTPFKVFEGNRPTNSILAKKLNPHTLGMLIAMYEHKIFVQGVIWNVYSFDQWGVELGKKLASGILPQLEPGVDALGHDSSTTGLINVYKGMLSAPEEKSSSPIIDHSVF